MNTVGLGKSDFLGQVQQGGADLALRGCNCNPVIKPGNDAHGVGLDVRHFPGCARLEALRILDLDNRTALIRPGRQ